MIIGKFIRKRRRELNPFTLNACIDTSLIPSAMAFYSRIAKSTSQ